MQRRDFTAFLAALPALSAPALAAPSRLARRVDDTLRPLMAEHRIPGLAVAVVAGGRQHHFAYGLASRETGAPVTRHTLFEVGSVSKTFTALLAAQAQLAGTLALSDPASRHVPALRGTRFDGITLAQLGTYAAGGLPLQFPDAVTDEAGMLSWYRAWQPAHAPGTHRLYSNPSIGLLGYATAMAMGRPFQELVQGQLLPALGLRDTWLAVPAQRMADYALGYTRDDKPVRVNPGVLDAQAYGIKTTAADLARYLEVQIEATGRKDALHRAAALTQHGHYRVGGMTQGLGWETYAQDAGLEALLAGNGTRMALEPHAVEPLDGEAPGQRFVNKTGSTNGFGAYVAFVPARRIGIALLANRNYPNAARVQAAHAILSALVMAPSTPSPARS